MTDDIEQPTDDPTETEDIDPPKDEDGGPDVKNDVVEDTPSA